jgi:hypothetical protein
MVYITGLTAVAYTVAIASTFLHMGAQLAALPGLNIGFVALLFVSHAGYLASKAFPHSSPAQPGQELGGPSLPAPDGQTPASNAQQDPAVSAPTSR